MLDQFDLRAGEVDGGRHQVEPRNRRGDDCLLERAAAGEQIVAGPVAKGMADAEAGRSVALRDRGR
jgi:hypothetical protein